MAYLNYTNPYDRVKKDWVAIDGKNLDAKRTETKQVKDVGGVFSSLSKGERMIDAGVLQAELIKRGIEVSHSVDLSPNGITISSAGILIALEEDPTPKQLQTIEDAILFVRNFAPKGIGFTGERGNKFRGSSSGKIL